MKIDPTTLEVHQTLLRCVLESDAAAMRYLRGKVKATTPMRLGILNHLAVIEPDKLPELCHVWDGKVRNGKAWGAHLLEAQDLGKPNCPSRKEYNAAIEFRDVVWGHPAIRDLLMGYSVLKEAELHKMAEAQGVDLRIHGFRFGGRLDWWVDRRLVDLKGMGRFGFRQIQRSIIEGTALQLSTYDDLGAQLGIPSETYHVAGFKTIEPFDAGVFNLTPDMMAWGRQKLAEGCAKLRRLLDAVNEAHEKEIPLYATGAYPEPVDVDLPPWLREDEPDPEFSSDGVDEVLDFSDMGVRDAG
jgi:hypothetical protein